MKNKIISRTPISTFSFPPSSIVIFNKACRRCSIIKVFGIAALSILILVGATGASPFAYIANLESNNVSVIDTATDTVKSLSEKWLPAITFTICNMQNRNGCPEIYIYCNFSIRITDFSDRL